LFSSEVGARMNHSKKGMDELLKLLPDEKQREIYNNLKHIAKLALKQYGASKAEAEDKFDKLDYHMGKSYKYQAPLYLSAWFFLFFS